LKPAPSIKNLVRLGKLAVRPIDISIVKEVSEDVMENDLQEIYSNP
jgi:hypothetical protein